MTILQTTPSPVSQIIAAAAAAEVTPVVWVVDDSPLQAEISRAGLAPRHDVFVFNDATAMIERLALGNPPDLILLDWHMPEMSGLEACHFIRKTADSVELPVIIITATGGPTDLLECLAAGANDFVRKPVTQAELDARIGVLVRTKRLYARLRITESALRAEASFREQFLAMLAHDLRQPLNVFALGSSTLAAADTSQSLRDSVAAQMGRASGRMNRMIAELLDFSEARPAVGIPIRAQKMSLGTVAAEVIEQIRLAHPNHTITLEIKDTCEGTWDSDRLAQVVSNLTENAIAHGPAPLETQDNPISVRVFATDGCARLTVENSGDAIPPAVLVTLFDAFRRGRHRRRGKGVGLGLYIVAQIVRAHDGTVTTQSVDGRTRFTVTLPFVAATGELSPQVWRRSISGAREDTARQSR